ncbi:tetratricopeptide repeat protein [Oscillatoriales cyanobacterium LEGE 11467]|uniref:Tetratricopeptide repeat protein n=1 Tax=Zarconia navalis LEGE 11467 TaxID=1828826 RepID=A0A928VYU8_9CYAN|nr:tetratricopeptide repeat protein [Zarconia navalis]MBE9042702.1 tetratricopeptide repeat protein [Zarconia navalis LEGE 11467]
MKPDTRRTSCVISSLGSTFGKSFAEETEPAMPDFDASDFNPTKTVTEKVDLAQAVRKQQYSVILGDPGAGKTTLLRYLALHFATARRDEKEMVVAGEEGEDLGQTRLPIFFRIADYAEKLATQPELKLDEFLQQFYRQWETQLTATSTEISAEEVAQLLCEKLKSGQCIVLLDGLDEVFDRSSRKQIVDRIEVFVSTYAGNKFVITSRIAGYQEVNLSGRFSHFTIIEMEREQVEQFLRRWCLAVEQAQQPDAAPERQERNAEAEVQGLLDAIDSNEGVQRLTGNPLLLTILALIHRNGSRLPHRRVELYALAVKTLTEDWQLGKKLPDGEKVLLKETEVVDLLAPLAYWMHEEKPSGLVSQEEVEAKLAKKLAELNDEEPDSPSVRQAVEAFLRRVRETTGLFVERAPGFYGFMHLTFEEYFAARYIADNDSEDMLALIRRHWEESRWMEPILLALGYCRIHMPMQLNKVVQKLFAALDDYQPDIERGEIQVKNGSASDPVLVFPVVDEAGIVRYEESATVLKELQFAARVLAEVEVSAKVRSKILNKLVLTAVGFDVWPGLELTEEFEEEYFHTFLRLLRQIELLYQTGETLNLLKKVRDNPNITHKVRTKSNISGFYIACKKADSVLMLWIEEIIANFEPLLFVFLKELVAEMGSEITPVLKKIRKQDIKNKNTQFYLDLATAISCLREQQYDKSIQILKTLENIFDSKFDIFLFWSSAICYQEKEKYSQSDSYYKKAFYCLSIDRSPIAFILCLQQRGTCYRFRGQYQQSLPFFKKALISAKSAELKKYEIQMLWQISKTYKDWEKYDLAIKWDRYYLKINQKLNNRENIASAYNNIGWSYQKWGKYKEAIEHYQKSLDFYQELNLQQKISNQWYFLGSCYRDWEKYQQALEYSLKALKIRQKLDDISRIALAYWQIGRIYQDWRKYEKALEFQKKDLELCKQLDDLSYIARAYWQLGWIYQDWGKYEEAIEHYQFSQKIYQQLSLEKDVASLWLVQAVCYREWGKYQDALECEGKDFEIRQRLEDRLGIAIGYYQLGRIYQGWGKYEEAIEYYQQSRQRYQQLDLEKDVASLWSWLASCYRDLEDYPTAIEHYQQSRDLHQKLGQNQNTARRYRQIGHSQRLLAKKTPDSATALDLFAQAEQNTQQATQLNTAGEYTRNLAYDAIALALIGVELLCHLPADSSQRPQRIAQFEAKYREGFDLLAKLGQTVSRAEKVLKIARAYSEVSAVQNLDTALILAREALKTFQGLNRRKLQAEAFKLLGEIHRHRGEEETARSFFTDSANLYQELDLPAKVAEVEELSANKI